MPEFREGFSALDRPEILQLVFYPRKDFSPQPKVPNAANYFISVEEGISICCRFYFNDERSPNILFFHGNGEIASDYDDIGPLYTQTGVNLFVADYRGYGLSGGEPTFTNLIRDAHLISKGFKQMLKGRGYLGGLFVMGRSLGSISAIEVAYHYQKEMEGLIIESGFADPIRLVAHIIGTPVRGGEIPSQLSNLKKIPSISIPTLIIHAENDSLIPVEEAEDLYHNSAAKDKRLVIIPKADHNTIFLVGMREYLKAIKEFVFPQS